MGNIRSQKGSERGRSKLTYSQVAKIRSLLATKEYTYAALAERYQVSASAIKKIGSGATWND